VNSEARGESEKEDRGTVQRRRMSVPIPANIVPHSGKREIKLTSGQGKKKGGAG